MAGSGGAGGSLVEGALRLCNPAMCVAVCLFLTFAAGCGKEKEPRFTAIPISGYPFPFGVNQSRVLGQDVWETEPKNCRNYVTHWLRNPPRESKWSGYSTIAVDADSAGTLQGFLATRTFANTGDAQQALAEMLNEIRRRYGTPTDSSIVDERLVRQWQDAAGASVVITDYSEESAQWMLRSFSAKMKKECPPESQ